jgi:broad specificity phosphatase PhoE
MRRNNTNRSRSKTRNNNINQNRSVSYTNRNQSASRTNTRPLQFNIYMVRHGFSCANAMKARGGWAATQRIGYTDPELTTIGRHTAIKLGPALGQAIRDPRFEKTILGSSNMLRAQQTLFFLTEAAEFAIVPYISETGMSEENRAFPFDKQLQILDDFTCDPGLIAMARNTEFYEKYKRDGYTPSISKFKQWILNEYGALKQTVPTEQTPNMLLVSHSGYIKELYKAIEGMNLSSSDIENYSLHKIQVELSPEGVAFTSMTPLPYAPSVPKKINPSAECEVNTCRKESGCGTRKLTKRETCELYGRGPYNLYTRRSNSWKARVVS